MSELIVPELTIYWAAATVLALGTIVFVGWMTRLPREIWSLCSAAVAACGFVAVGYVLMANEIMTVTSPDGSTPYGRFVGYIFLFGIACWVLWRISDADRVWLGVLVGATYLWIVSVIVNWQATGTAELAALGGIVFAFATVIYVVFGPLAAAATAASGERRLLFGKLRNLTTLVLVLYLVVGVVNDHGTGTLDTFVGIFVSVYLDVLFVLGIGTILFRGETALRQTATDGSDEGGDSAGGVTADPAGDVSADSAGDPSIDHSDGVAFGEANADAAE